MVFKSKFLFLLAAGLCIVTAYPTTNGPEDEHSFEEVPIPTGPRSSSELTKQTFAPHIAKGHHFIMFYTAWCYSSQRLAPTWEKLADLKLVPMSKLDCGKYSGVCRQLNFKGVPTLMWFHDGVLVEKYVGNKEYEEMKSYIEKMMSKSS